MNARSVLVSPPVVNDIFQALQHNRTILGNVLFDLNNYLPNNLAHYQSKRIAGSPRCFWYENTYSLELHSFEIRRLRFAVRDSDPFVLEVIWVVVVQ